jgi:hypothetical protein
MSSTTDTSQDPAGSSYKVTWATIKAAILALFSGGTGITFSGGVISSDPTATQTLTNKTLTSPTINTPSISAPTLTGTSTFNGTYAGSMVVPLVNGGTGAITQLAAAQAVLPSMAAQAGNFLTTDGTNASWALPGSVGSTQSSLTVGPAVTANQALYVGPYQSDGGIKLDTSGTAATSNTVNITVGANSNRGLVVFAYRTPLLLFRSHPS